MRALSVTTIVLAVMATGAQAGPPCEIDDLVALDAASGDDGGASVSIDGTIAVLGAPEDDDAGSSSGAAYAFRFGGASWAQDQKLTASDAESGDDYGFAVAVSGDTIVVGSPRDDTAAGSRAGSAYVYRYNGATLLWEEEDRLFAADAAADDRFGTSVAIDGDTIVVGATQEDGVVTNSGAGYVFVRVAGVWSQQGKLTDSAASGTNPQLGHSAGIDGDVVVLGAWQDAPAAMFSVGAAVVFRRAGLVWSAEQKLTASDAADFRWFGKGVAVSGDVVAVGAYGDQALALGESGGAYLYRFNGATWDEEDNINASTPVASDRFGWSIAIRGTCVVVGSGSSAARAWVFGYDGANWVEDNEVLSASIVSGEYGYSVATDGVSILVGDRAGAANGGQGLVFAKDACATCPEDLDGNGSVGFADLNLLLTAWGPCPGCPEDLGGNGSVGFADLNLVLTAWGPCP